MIVLLHVLIALGSLGFAGRLLFRPSRRALHVSYGLIAGTLLSGTYLVVSTHSPMLQSCATGLGYLGTVTALTLLAQRRLARTAVQ